MAIWTLCLVLTTTIVATLQSNSPIIYSQLTTAHVSYENFKILYYFDIKYMYDLSIAVDQVIENGEKLCNQTATLYCNMALKQISKNRVTIKNTLNRIDNYESRRVKRFCKWCGSAISWATGLLENEVAEVYDKKINELQNATITQHDLLRNQTYIMQTSMNINTEILEKLEQAIHNTDMEIGRVMRSFNKLETAVRFNEIIQLIDLMNDEQREIIHEVVQTLTEAKLGRIPDIINEERLNQDIKNIHNGLSANQALPIDFKNEAAMKIFKYATTAATKYKYRIMIEITIPVTSREKYTLYKATPIPIKINGFTLISKIETKYFLLNKDETKFINLEDKDLETGLKIGENEMIYKPSAIVKLDKSNICEWKLMSEPSIDEILEICEVKQIPKGNYVFEVNENDVYFLSINDELRITTECNNGEVTKKSIIQDEILKIQPNCTVKTSSFTIQPHNTYTIDTARISTPDFWNETIPKQGLEAWLKKNLTNIEISKPVLVTEFSQLHDLINDAENLAENANFDLKLENVHMATKTSSFIWILIAVGIILLIITGTIIYLLHRIGLVKMLLGPEAMAMEQTANVVFRNLKSTPHPTRKTEKNDESEP